MIRNPESIRPWQHVLEPLQGYIVLAEQLLTHGKAFAQAWNFGPSEEDARPVRWIVDRFVKQWGKEATWQQDQSPRPHEAGVLRVDSTLARQKLGWRPRLRLPEAVDLTVDWYRRSIAGEDAATITLQQIAQYQQRSPANS